MSLRRRLDYLLARQYGLITRGQALQCGLSIDAIQRRLVSKEWIRVYQTVYRAAAVPVTWRQELLALCLRKPTRVWVSHRSAGALWGLDDCEQGFIEVTTTCDFRGSRPLVIHRVKEMPLRHVTMLGAIPLTTVHRTLIDLGGAVDPDAVEIAYESALRRGLSTPERFRRELEYSTGQRGAAVIRAILGRHDGRPTESALETRFVQLLRRHRIPQPERQHTIRDSGFVARVDFFFESCGVVIEVDGRTHHLRRAQWETDLRRRNGLTSQGVRVLHVTYERMRTDPSGIAHEIRSATSARGLV